jgi:hypothetical protein
MSKATSIYIDADACPVKAGIETFPVVAPDGLSVNRIKRFVAEDLRKPFHDSIVRTDILGSPDNEDYYISSTDPEYLERMAVGEEARHPAGIGGEDVAAPPLLTGQSARPPT